MGLKPFRFFSAAFILLASTTLLDAAPMLRLVSATVGPVEVGVGAASQQPQSVEAYNAGDGTMALSLSSSVTWISPSVGASQSCATTTLAKVCTLLVLGLNTSSLAAGTYTGVVTVSDPNTIDAPQTITVTVIAGPSVPASVTAYVQPGGSFDYSFSTNYQVAYSAVTQDGHPWLSLALDGAGSFRFVYPYRIHIQPPASANLGVGTYNGTLTTGMSPFSPDDRAVPITMQITLQPIAQVSITKLSKRLAQGAPPYTAFIPVADSGQAGLLVQTVSATGSGITAQVSGPGVSVTFDPGTLAVGDYTGSITIGTNAINTLAPIPVDFQVVAKGNPFIPYQNVVDGATFTIGGSLNPGDIATIFGEQLLFGTPVVGQAPPLSTQLGTTQVLVNGTAVPLYYAQYDQVNFQVPEETPVGTAKVQVVRDGLTSNAVSVIIAARAPRLLSLGTTGYGAIQNASNGYSLPLPLGSFPGYQYGAQPAHLGDVLQIYAIGLGLTNPTVATGAPAPTSVPAMLTVTPLVTFGNAAFGTTTSPSFVGLTPGAAGLYQVNVAIPPTYLGSGTTPVSLRFGDGTTTNTVNIEIQH